jgi:hypothetical protein
MSAVTAGADAGIAAGAAGGGADIAAAGMAGGGAGAPVMLGARTIGPGADPTVGGMAPTASGVGRTCIGAQAPSKIGPSKIWMAMVAAITAVGRRPDFAPCQSGLSAMIGILDPRRCSPGDYNQPALYETGREAWRLN